MKNSCGISNSPRHEHGWLSWLNPETSNQESSPFAESSWPREWTTYIIIYNIFVNSSKPCVSCEYSKHHPVTSPTPLSRWVPMRKSQRQSQISGLLWQYQRPRPIFHNFPPGWRWAFQHPTMEEFRSLLISPSQKCWKNASTLGTAYLDTEIPQVPRPHQLASHPLEFLARLARSVRRSITETLLSSQISAWYLICLSVMYICI